MSYVRAAIRAGLCAALLLTDSCGGGSSPPRAAQGPGEIDLTKRSGSGAAQEPNEPADNAAAPNTGTPIRFEDLPVTRLDRAKVPIPNAANPSLGAVNAPVVVQMWSDFECPFCARAHPVLSELLRIYAGKVRLVWHDYPLPFHAHARLAANAGREAYAEGGAAAFWKFHDAIYEAPETDLDAASLERFAAKAGLDATRFHESLGTLRHDGEIKQDMAIGDAVGVEGTPAFLVNDYFFVGAVPIEIMRVIVGRALSDVGG
ncbi:MAG TPA: thioredoxin domain-containing protein [Polyangiaceae bacterium]|nr:thioredoxin domain-containing protein [Polyangiaceae bacterium]